MAMERLRDAEALLAGGRWDYAYYVSGYAVECALKSCVLARMVETGIVYKSEKPVDFRTHDFNRLVEQAGIKDELNTEIKASLAAGRSFVIYWNIVGDWNVESQGDCVIIGALGDLGIRFPGQFNSVAAPFPDFQAVVQIIPWL